jgi:hypothetical protein
VFTRQTIRIAIRLAAVTKFFRFSAGSRDELQDKSFKKVTTTSLQIPNYWPFIVFLTNSKVTSSTFEDAVSNIESLKNEATFCLLLRNYWFCMEGFTEAQHRLL